MNKRRCQWQCMVPALVLTFFLVPRSAGLPRISPKLRHRESSHRRSLRALRLANTSRFAIGQYYHSMLTKSHLSIHLKSLFANVSTTHRTVCPFCAHQLHHHIHIPHAKHGGRPRQGFARYSSVTLGKPAYSRPLSTNRSSRGASFCLLLRKLSTAMSIAKAIRRLGSAPSHVGVCSAASTRRWGYKTFGP